MEVQICTVAHGEGLGNLQLFMRTHLGTPAETAPCSFHPGDMAVVKVVDSHASSLVVQLLLLDGASKPPLCVALSSPVDLYRTVASSVVAVVLQRTQDSMAQDPTDVPQAEWGTLRLAWSWRRAEPQAQAGPGWAQPVSGSGLGGHGWKNSKQLYCHTSTTTQWLPSPRAIRTAVEKSLPPLAAMHGHSSGTNDHTATASKRHALDNAPADAHLSATQVYQFPIRFVGPKDATSPRKTTTTPRRADSAKDRGAKDGTPSVVQRLYPQHEQQRVEESPQRQQQQQPPQRDESGALVVKCNTTGGAAEVKAAGGSARKQRPTTSGRVKPLNARLCPRNPSDPHEEILRLQRRMEELQADRRKVEGLSQRTSALDSLFTGS